jgi:serine/threonine-protein kinase
MASGLPPRIGPFEPVELLAEGGMARVVVARQPGIEGFERLAALKLILPELAAEASYTTMFLDEARINSRVHHPNVVGVLDVGRDELTHILYMAMDLVLGATLSQVVRAEREPLPTPVMLDVLAQAADGLQAAHAATAADGTHLDIVHRDVSPANLLIGLDARVRVSDFGVARAAQRMTRTKTGQFKGKLAYCSPEQALGNRVDRRADIFALGVVAFEVASRRRLFHGATPFETLERILRLPIPSFGELRPDLGPAAEMLDAMLARQPADRPSSAGEVAEVLRDAIARGGFEPSTPDLVRAVEGAASPVVRRLAGLDHAAQPASESPEAQSVVTAPARPVDFDPTVVELGGEPEPGTAVAGWWESKE